MVFGSSLTDFSISISLNLKKVNTSLPSKCFSVFLVEWFLKYHNKLSKDFFFRAVSVFFDLRVFVIYVKDLFKVCDIFLLSLTILLFFVEDDCVSGFTFIREERFHGLPEFVSARNTFEI